MSKKALYAVLLITGVAAAGSLAMAAEPYLPKAQKSFDRIDLNKDGKINLAEFTPVAEKRFLGIDVNKATLQDLSGRPQFLVDNNYQPMRELI
jgi:hypothetical protein